MAGTVAGAIPGGESPNEKANKWLEAVPDFTYKPRSMGGQAGMEGAAALAEKGVEGTKFVGSGYAGLPVLLSGGGVDEAVTAMEDFKETPDAMAEGVFEHTQSPTMAAVAKILPEIASMASPVKKPRVRTPRPDIAPDMPPSGYGGVGDIDVPEPPRPIPETGPGGRPVPEAPDPDSFARLQDALERGDKQAILAEVNANPAIVAAFEQLGIEFTPAMVSDAAALRQIEAGLASRADTGLTQAHELVEFKLNEKARQLIDDAGGNPDSPATTAAEIDARYEEIHSGMRNSEGEIWDDLRTKVPRETSVNAGQPASRIYREAELAGNGDVARGLKSLRQHERRLFEMTHRRIEDPETGEIRFEYDEPSYAAVDRFREDLGNSMQTGKPFGDANSGMLDQMYGEMAAIQGRVAKAEGYGEQWTRANQMTIERKSLEQAMQRVQGRGLNQSVVTRINGAVNALVKGDVKKWDQLFEDLPADVRQAAAAQALDQVFFTAGKNTKMSQTFVNNFERIRRDPQIRDRIFDQLPMEARSQFMAIGEAATGFYRAMEKLNRSNTANAMQVIKAIEQPGFMARVLGGAAERTTGRIPIIGDWMRTVLRSTPDQASAAATSRLKAGTDLLMDPAVHRAIVEYAAGRVDAANQILKNSQSWAAWAKTQPIPMQERIQTAGIVALFEEENE